MAYHQFYQEYSCTVENHGLSFIPIQSATTSMFPLILSEKHLLRAAEDFLIKPQ